MGKEISGEIRVRVRCHTMPTAASGAGATGWRVEYLWLGVQVGEAVEQLVPIAAGEAHFEVGLRVAPLPGGGTNFLGPAAKGTLQERFFYLCWHEVVPGERPRAMGRVKIHLSHLPWALVEAAARREQPLEVALAMTGARGEPRCASVRPPEAVWTAGAAD